MRHPGDFLDASTKLLLATNDYDEGTAYDSIDAFRNGADVSITDRDGHTALGLYRLVHRNYNDFRAALLFVTDRLRRPDPSILRPRRSFAHEPDQRTRRRTTKQPSDLTLTHTNRHTLVLYFSSLSQTRSRCRKS